MFALAVIAIANLAIITAAVAGVPALRLLRRRGPFERRTGLDQGTSQPVSPDRLSTETLIKTMVNRRSRISAFVAAGMDAATYAATAALIAELLREESSPSVAVVGEWALERICRATPQAIAAFARDQSPPIRRAAVIAAGRLIASSVSADASLRTIVESSSSDPSPIVRAAACAMLGQMRDVDARSSLARALQDEDESVRRAGVRAIAAIGDARATTALIRLLAAFPGSAPQLVLEALDALRPPDEMLQGVSTCFADETLKQAAVLAGGSVGTEPAGRWLVQRLTDDDEDVRRLAALSLARIGQRYYPTSLPSTLVDRIISCLTHESAPRVVSALINALAFSGDSRTPAILLARLPDASNVGRERILEALAVFGQLEWLPRS